MSSSALLLPVTVRLDPRRLAQLKNIAEAEKRSSAGVIAALIRDKIAAGVISSDIPGISVKREGDELTFRIDGSEPVRMSRERAAEFVGTIRGVVSKAQRGTVNMDLDFAVSRVGSGILIQVPMDGQKHAFPPDLAADLADLIEARAA